MIDCYERMQIDLAISTLVSDSHCSREEVVAKEALVVVPGGSCEEYYISTSSDRQT